MVCSKCNSIIPDDSKFCENCGAPVEQQEAVNQEVVQEVTNENPVTDNASEAENIQQPINGNPSETAFLDNGVIGSDIVNKSGKSKKIGIIAAVIALCGALTAFGATVGKPLVKSIFLSDEAHYRDIEINALENDIDTVSALFKNVKDIPMQGSGNVKLVVTDDCIEAIEDMAGESLDDYIGDIRSVGVSYDVAMNDNSMGVNMKASLGDVEIAELDYALDDDAMYISMPGLLDKAVEIDTSDYMSGLSDMIMSPANKLSEFTFDDKLSKEMIKALETALKEIKNVEKSRTTVSAGDVTQKCSVYTIEFDEDVLDAFMTSLLESTKENEVIIDEVMKFIDLLEDISDEDFDVSKSDIKDALDDVLDEMDFDDVEFTYSIYVDSKDNIIGREFEVEDATVRMVTAEKGKKYAFECIFDAGKNNTASIEGNGEKVNDKFTGEVDVEVAGKKLVSAEVEDYYYNLEKMEQSGKISLKMGSGLSELLDIDSIAKIGIKTMKLDIAVDSKKDASNYSIALKIGDTEYARLDVSGTATTDYKVNIPSDTYDVESDSDEIVENISIDSIIDKLEDAGIPSDVLDYLEMMMMPSSSYSNYEYGYGDYGDPYAGYGDYGDPYNSGYNSYDSSNSYNSYNSYSSPY